MGIDLAGWLRTSLIGITLGFATAAYSSVWAGQNHHGGVMFGCAMILVSLALTLIFATRHLGEVSCQPRTGGQARAGRMEAVLSVVLALGLSWAAIAIVLFAIGRHG